MLAILEISKGILELGFIYSLVVLAVHLTSRTIVFDDLTMEGSFGIGGAVAARCALAELSPIIALPLSIIAGILAGIITGLLSKKLKLNNLISSLIVTTALFSISKKVAGSAMVTIPFACNLFEIGIIGSFWTKLIILGFISFIITFSIRWLLQTEIGGIFRALGSNPQMLTNLGKSINGYTIAAICIANGLTALAGALFVHYTSFFSITGNIGTFIFALAGLMFAEIISNKVGFALIFGAIAYPMLYTLTIELQLDPDLTKLITAFMMIGMLLLKKKNITHLLR